MQKFDTFCFERFEFDKLTLKAKFYYNFDRQEYFEEEIDFSSDNFLVKENLDNVILDNILFHLHIAL
jgi:hypothetical protein